MTYFRRSGGQIALFVLSVIAIGISVYLTIIHYTHTAVVCSTSGLINCEVVLNSHYALVPGTNVPVSLAGLLYFVASAALALAAWLVWPQLRALRTVQVAWSALGILTILYLVYVEIVLVHALCAWCTALHVIILATFVISVLLLQDPSAAEDEDFAIEEEEPTVIRGVNARK